MEPNGISSYNAIVVGVDPLVVRDYAQANGIHVEFAGDAARLNHGFPLGITPYSSEAKYWKDNSPVFSDQQTRWHRIIADFGC